MVVMCARTSCLLGADFIPGTEEIILDKSNLDEMEKEK
jgi:hypothetical protein